MTQSRSLAEENEMLRERLGRLSGAILRINESIEFDTVLQEVLDAARELSDARYAVITLFGASGDLEQFLATGLTPEEAQGLWEMPGGADILDQLRTIPGSLRVPDFSAYARALSLPEFRPPAPMNAFLSAPIRHRGESIGNIFLGKHASDAEFTDEDEEALVMFASQTALVIINARRYRDEQRARNDLEALLNTAPVGVAVFDARTGALLSFNGEAERIVRKLQGPGQGPEELLQVMTIQRADGRKISPEDATLAQALSSGETVRAEEIVINVPDGRAITTLMNATPIRSADGELDSVMVTLQDLTALEELDRLRTEFLAMVSHELQIPLTSIKGSTTALLRDGGDLDPAEMRQFFRIIDYQADHMNGLMSDLLDMARIETGTLSVDPQPVRVESLVDEAKSRFISAGGRNPLRIKLAPELPRVMADARRIIQVIGNLLSNAARYSPEISPIGLTAEHDGVHVTISVVDEGAGLDPEQVPQLFGKFARVDGQTRRRGLAGSGLGLAICKGIVEAHGGRIHAESEGAGMGSRFIFTLPANGEAEAAVASPVRPARESEPGRTRVLAVDDDPQALRYVREVLTRAGYVATVTADPSEVLTLVVEERPDLVLLDLMLPGTDGIQLMSQILEVTNIPVIFVSVYGQDEYIVRAFDMGATDYVVKPFSASELGARIRSALRKRVPADPPEPVAPYELGDLAINYAERRVTVAGEPVELTPTEYRVLLELSASAGRVLTHNQLLERVWGSGQMEGTAPVRNIVSRLRRKLGDSADHPQYLFSEARVGYRMAKPEA